MPSNFQMNKPKSSLNLPSTVDPEGLHRISYDLQRASISDMVCNLYTSIIPTHKKDSGSWRVNRHRECSPVRLLSLCHSDDVNAMAPQIICVSIVNSGADQRNHQISALLAFVRGIHRWLVNSPHKDPVTRMICPFDGVIMRFYIYWCRSPCYEGTIK